MSDSSISNKKLVLLLITVISVIILIICAIRLSIYSLVSYREAKANATLKDMVGESSIILAEDFETGRPVVTSLSDSSLATGETNIKKPALLDKYKSLYRLNSDIVGWVCIEDTSIDYPVMQTKSDEEYYLHRNFYREEAKSGLPFMDSRCSITGDSSNTIIYGHCMKDGSMFADLTKYSSRSYYENHKYIRFDTIYEEAMYEIVAVFRTVVKQNDTSEFKFYNFLNAESADEFTQYISKIQSMSLYSIDATAISTDTLLTLSTCDHSTDDGRFVVVARKIKNQTNGQ